MCVCVCVCARAWILLGMQGSQGKVQWQRVVVFKSEDELMCIKSFFLGQGSVYGGRASCDDYG